MPFTTSFTVPSPPTTTTNRPPASRADLARRVASPGPCVNSSRYGRSLDRRVRSSSGTSCPTRRRPACGLTITESSPKGDDIARILQAAGSDPRVGDDPSVHRLVCHAHGLRRALRRDLLELPQEVEDLFAGSDEVAGRHLAVAKHVLERFALRPSVQRAREPVLELAAQLDLVAVLRGPDRSPEP